ncbi:hypothetical protein BUGL105410_23210 [Burkholderia gladioli]
MLMPNCASDAGSIWLVDVFITRRVLVTLSACSSISLPDWIRADTLLTSAAFV